MLTWRVFAETITYRDEMTFSIIAKRQYSLEKTTLLLVESSAT